MPRRPAARLDQFGKLSGRVEEGWAGLALIIANCIIHITDECLQTYMAPFSGRLHLFWPILGYNSSDKRPIINTAMNYEWTQRLQLLMGHGIVISFSHICL